MREIELIENVNRSDFSWDERAKLEKEIMRLKREQDPEWNLDKQSEYLGQSSGRSHRRLELATWIEEIPELADSKNEDEAWKKLQRLKEEVVLSSMRAKDTSGDYDGAIKYAKNHYKIGDALKEIKKVNSGVVDFCEVDPPYGVDLPGRKSRNKDLKKLDRYNEVDKEDYPKFLEDLAKEVFRILRDDTWCVWWFGPEWYAHVLITLNRVGFQVNKVPAIWTKENSQGQTASPDTALGSSYEPFFYARKGKPTLSKPGRKNEFRFEPVAPQKKIHPTERPLSLMSEIMETFTYPNSVVCVPFLGSGVSLRAAYLAGHTGYGWDLDDMCKERFLNAVYRDEMEKK